MALHHFIMTGTLFMLLACNTPFPQPSNTKKEPGKWNTEDQQALIARREDSTQWDTSMLKNDMQCMGKDRGLPVTDGVFPTPYYDACGKESFKGVGNWGYPGGAGSELKIGNKTILFNSFFARANIFNQPYIGNKTEEIFFHIMVLTDWVDTVNYSHVSSEIVSRNHPDYVGQGYYKTRHGQIDYIAFCTAKRNSYAIINMRLFDLTLGKTILIAPQKDGSFRSMQISSPAMQENEIESYTQKLIQEQKVIEFFTAPGNI